MCRLAAYTGIPISLHEFLLRPEHNLIEQAWRPREMREAVLNADGFGFSWYADDGHPAIYRNTCPIWSDPNLESLARSLVRDRWLATIRSATLMSDVAYANTQPFIDGEIMFTHNGYLADFASHWRGQIRKRLDPENENKIHGTTDSEYLFALFCQFYGETGSIAAALAGMIVELDEFSAGSRALLNFIVCSNEQLVALRHAIGDECPSLYYHVEGDDNQRSVRIASEALTAEVGWISIGENQLLVVDNDAEVSIRAI
jgi:glutamine amidotransferase